MTVRIWHQSFTVLSDLGDYDRALREHFATVSRPDTVIDMHGMRPGTYNSDYPGDDIRYAVLQYLHTLQFVGAGLQAERDGYDAYAISSLPDPGLAEIRSLLRIPVVGYGESAMRSACSLGERFGVLVFIDGLEDLVAHNALRLGLGTRFTGVRHAGFRFNDVLEGFNAPGPLIDRFRSPARGLIEAGAEAIVPGEAPLNVLLAREDVTAVDGVPVVDSLAAWVKRAEAMSDLQRAHGVVEPAAGYFTARPPRERVEQVLAFYGLREWSENPAGEGND